LRELRAIKRGKGGKGVKYSRVCRAQQAKGPLSEEAGPAAKQGEAEEADANFWPNYEGKGKRRIKLFWGNQKDKYGVGRKADRVKTLTLREGSRDYASIGQKRAPMIKTTTQRRRQFPQQQSSCE